MTNTHLDQTFLEKMKARLLSEQARLMQELKLLPEHTELGNRDDDNAKEAEEDEVHLSIKTKVSQDLEKIAKALLKMEQGTYGTDDDGQPIAKERLEALPWADRGI